MRRCGSDDGRHAMTKLAILAAAILVVWSAANLTPVETARSIDRSVNAKGANIGETLGTMLAPSRETMGKLETSYTRQRNERLSK